MCVTLINNFYQRENMNNKDKIKELEKRIEKLEKEIITQIQYPPVIINNPPYQTRQDLCPYCGLPNTTGHFHYI